MDYITIYTLNTDGSMRSRRVGNIDSIMFAVDIENLDYTLVKPPNYSITWYWYNNQWNDMPKQY